MNWTFFNPRNVLIIAAVTVAIHMLAKPLYAAIDNAAD